MKGFNSIESISIKNSEIINMKAMGYFSLFSYSLYFLWLFIKNMKTLLKSFKTRETSSKIGGKRTLISTPCVATDKWTTTHEDCGYI